jgi:hypothetical protein
MLSLVRYIRPLANWRNIMKHGETKDTLFNGGFSKKCHGKCFGGCPASLGVLEYTPLLLCLW